MNLEDAKKLATRGKANAAEVLRKKIAETEQTHAVVIGQIEAGLKKAIEKGEDSFRFGESKRYDTEKYYPLEDVFVARGFTVKVNCYQATHNCESSYSYITLSGW